MAKEKCPECPKPCPAWLTTYGDLMSLLLTFFILLLAFSSPNQAEEQKMKFLFGALQGGMGVLKGEPILSSPLKMNVPMIKGQPNKEPLPSLHEAKEEIEKEIKQQQQQQNVEVKQTAEGLLIRFKDRALFGSGSASINSELLPLLGRIGDVLARMSNVVEIEGHTDSNPIHNPTFPNNYWLSSARALKVLDLFMYESGISPDRLSAVGYGEFRPLADNGTPEGQAANRRVEIKIREAKGGAGAAPPANVRKLLEDAQLPVE